jgi:peptide deformylase
MPGTEAPDAGAEQAGAEQPGAEQTDAEALAIVGCGDPVLRRPAEPVDPASLPGNRMQRLIAQMRATMYAAPGVGLAAPQIGVPLQIAVMQDDPQRWGQLTDEEQAARERVPLPFTVLVNPEIEPAGDDQARFYEGCLSVPGLTGLVARHRAIRVRAFDEHGQPVDRVLSGWPARIVQHEVDHLRGILYLDRVETRSLSTADNYARLWAGRSPAEAAAALGFTLTDPPPAR